MAGMGEDTIIVHVYGTRVRIDRERPAAYLKEIADAPCETYVAFRFGEKLLGVADRAAVAEHVEDGETITFQPQSRLAGFIGGPRAVQPTTIYVNGHAVTVDSTTTVGDLRERLHLPRQATAAYRDHDAARLQPLADDDRVLAHVAPGGTLAFHDELIR